MAGVWKQWLFSDFLWKTDWGFESRQAPTPVCLEDMPSWTWASTICHVSHDFHAFEIEHAGQAFTIVSIDCEPRTGNMYGQVKPHSSITIDAQTFHVALGISDCHYSFGYTVVINRKPVQYPDKLWPDTIIVEDENKSKDENSTISSTNTSTSRRIRLEKQVHPIKHPLTGTAYCLYLGGGRYFRSKGQDVPLLREYQDRHFYLLLGPVHGYSTHQGLALSRLGMLEMSRKPLRSAKKTRVTLL